MKHLLFIIIYFVFFLELLYSNETQKIVGSIIDDIFQTKYYAKEKNFKEYKSSKFTHYSIKDNKISIKFTNEFNSLGTVLDSPWDSNAYSQLIDNVEPKEYNVDLVWSNALLDANRLQIQNYSKEIEGLFEDDLNHGQAHAKAAMLIGTFALHESSGRFFDIRQLLNRMTMHLAFALKLTTKKYQNDVHSEVYLAQQIQFYLTGREDLIKVDSNSSSHWHKLLHLLSSRNFDLYPEENSLLFIKFKTKLKLIAFDGKRSSALLEEIKKRKNYQDESWAPLFYQDPPSRKILLKELPEQILIENKYFIGLWDQLYPDKALNPDAVSNILNLPTNYFIHQDAFANLSFAPLSLGDFSAQFQRHICHLITFAPNNNSILRSYGELDLFPYVLLQQKINSKHLDRATILEAIQLFKNSPYLINILNSKQLTRLIEDARIKAEDISPISPYQNQAAILKTIVEEKPFTADLKDLHKNIAIWYSPERLIGTNYQIQLRENITSDNIDSLLSYQPNSLELLARKAHLSPNKLSQKQQNLLKRYPGLIRNVSWFVKSQQKFPNSIYELRGTISPTDQILLAREAILGQQPAKAIPAIQKAIVAGLDPRDAPDLIEWYFEHLIKQKNQEAIDNTIESLSLWNEYYGRLTLANAYKNTGKEDFALQWYQALLKAYPFQQDMLDFWLKDAGINFDQEHQQFIIGLIKKTYTNSEFTNEQLQHAIKRLEELIFPNGKHYFKVPKVPPSSGVELTAIDPALSYLNLKPGDILVAANRYELQTLAQYFLVRIPFTGKMMRFTLWDGKQYRTVSAPLAVWDRTIKVKPFFRTDEQIIQDRITHWEAMADTSLVCNLSNLGLKEIPPALLKLHGLRYLSLRNNKLEELGTDFHKLTSLERVDLSFNDLASFGEELYTLPNIQLINLSNNRLSGTVKLNALPQLKNLNLSSNQITFLTGEISPTLQKLNLSHNHLQEMPAFAKTSIISLDLKSNHFTNMAPNLGKWQKLKSLDLSENEINELPASYSELTNLKILNLSKNEPSIKSSLKHLPKGLKSLYVQNLYLNKIFSILPPLNEIENLKIDQNNLLFLEDFDSHFFPSLKRLSLAGNQIRSLDEKIYSKLVYLDISDNPLDPSFTVKLTQVYKGKLKND